jgi:L-amino acid N-acyltransferase YncA
VKGLLFRAVRTVAGLRRPSRKANLKRLGQLGEPPTFTIQDATAADIPVIARVHVRSWNDTYARLARRGPRVELREQQWRQAFANPDGSWFCIAVTTARGELVGFAKGVRTEETGELNKIYLLREYQRLGLGRKLVGAVTKRFLAQGVTSMCCYADPRNPSCAFFEKLGATRLREPTGRINYSWYIWHDLPRLASTCAEKSRRE